MIYLYTSVVVALLTPEERSAQALDWFAQSREPLISSDWLIIGSHSALAFKLGSYEIKLQAVQASFRDLEQWLPDGIEKASLAYNGLSLLSSC
ncbi:hypothetical protein NZK33_04940 [Cyanobium sp. FGCU-6]|nr:hypothetical protein [Cyanobium sp. FGCU6]